MTPRNRTAALALLLATACAPTAPAGPAARVRCALDTRLDGTKPGAERQLPPHYWMTLLLPSYRPKGASSGEIARPARDCEGQPLEWAADACPIGPAPERAERTEIPNGDLVITHLGGSARLIWAMIDRFANGEALGPVNVTDFDARGVTVRWRGTLRAYPVRPQLRLEKLGGGTVLVAEGETCEREDDPGSCRSGVRLVPLVNTRFVPRDLTDGAGGCLGSTFFPRRQVGTFPPGPRGSRYELDVALTFGTDEVAIQEQLAIQPPSLPGEEAAAAFVKRVQATRTVRLDGGRLVASKRGLLDRWIRQQTGKSED